MLVTYSTILNSVAFYMTTLIIDNINIELLEKQRLILQTIDYNNLTVEQAEALQGIQNMLDNWSDNTLC